MSVKTVKCTNNSDDSITFGHHFFLDDDFDLSGLAANVNYSESTKDGASYQSTVLSTRSFSLPFFIKMALSSSEWIEMRRQEAYKVFNPKKNPITFEFTTEGGNEYIFTAELTSTPIFASSKDFEESNDVWQNGLLQFTCADPYIYKKDTTIVYIATWIPNLVFPIVIPDDGIAFAYRTPSLIANVVNDGQDDSGIVIRFRATSSVSKPSLINVNTYEVLKLNMNLEGGDVVDISTERGKRYGKLIRNNVTTSVFGKVALESSFLQITPGDNLFRYDAESGLDNLEVSIHFRNKFLGV